MTAKQSEEQPIQQTVLGRTYSLWPQIVAKKSYYIGGVLEDYSEQPSARTKIKDITFGEFCGSPSFQVIGEDFDCGFNVEFGGVNGSHPPQEGSLHFSAAYGLNFSISLP